MKGADVKFNMRVRVREGEHRGRRGHVITLPIGSKPGVVVLEDDDRAFLIDEALLEPEVPDEQPD